MSKASIFHGTAPEATHCVGNLAAEPRLQSATILS
jgi:hypothetical protein